MIAEIKRLVQQFVSGTDMSIEAANAIEVPWMIFFRKMIIYSRP